MRKASRTILSMVLILGVSLTSVCGGVRIHGVTPEAKQSKAAESGGRYVKDIKISYASSKQKAENELGSDYTVLDKNFNEGMSGDSWIGYSTTDDANQALKDIKAMPMDGKYSTSDYEELLKNQKKVIETQVETVIPAIIEYAKNVNAEVPTAETVRKLLNVYHEDDSDMNMGEYLLAKGNALIKNKKDSAVIKDLQKIYMEGNNYVVSTIEGLLAMVQGDNTQKVDSWTTRMSVLGPDGLYNVLKQKNPKKSKTYINNLMKEEFGDDAEKLYKEISVLRDRLKEAQESAIVKAEADESVLENIKSDISGDDIEEVPYDSDSDELMDAMFQEMDNGIEAAEVMSDLTAYAIEKMLKETPYGTGKTLYDLFMDEKLKKEDLYTMAYVLSSGQKSMVESVGIYPLFENALVDYANEDSEPLGELEFGENMYSVYEWIDRSVFKGDTAITAETLKNMETKQFKDPIGLNSGDPQLVVLGLLMSVGLSGAAIWSFTSRTHVSWEFFDPDLKELKIMKKNLKMMNTYDNAWKIQKLEKLGYLDEGTLKGIEAGESAAKEVDEVFSKTIKRMKASPGNTAFDLAETIEKAGTTEKTAFVTEYSGKVKTAQSQYNAWLKENKVKVPRASWEARICFSLAAVLAIAFAGYEIYCMVHKDKVNFAHIPEKVVARTYEGSVEYLTYHVVTTKSGSKADIHNKKGKGWQVLYTTTDDRMGDPILASSLSVESFNYLADQNLVPVTYFDYKYAANLADEDYTGSETNSAYLFFRKGTEVVKGNGDTSDPASGGAADTTASVFGASSIIWLVLLFVVVFGVGVGTGIFVRRRKKED